MRRAIIDAVREVKSTFSFAFVDHMHVAVKVLKGAVQKYAKDCREIDIVAIMDTTLFGSGKEGFLFTKHMLYNSYAPKQPIDLRETVRVELQGKDHLVVHRKDGRKDVCFATIYAPYVCDVLNAVLRNAGQTSSPAADSGDLEKKAEQEYNAGNHDQAAKLFLQAAQAGSASARDWMGYLCEKGHGVAQDHTAAVRWYRMAAEQGYARARCNLAHCYMVGRGADKDEAEAAKWYRKAAEQGHARAQCNLGVCYENGIGVEKDLAEARRWYELSAAQGHDGAKRALERLGAAPAPEQPKHEGAAAPTDSLEAALAQLLASQQKGGQTPAAHGGETVDALLTKGREELKAKRYEAAREYFRKAAEQGNAEAAYELGRMCHEGQGADKDDAQAVEWYRKGAEAGYAQAQNALGRMYDKGWGVSKNYSDAFHWYRKAAEQGLATAQFNVGNMYYHGDGVPGDYSAARDWYMKAAQQGNAKAMYGLGQIYENGKGVKEDEAEALKWYRKAADKGHEKAKAAVERLTKKEEAPGDMAAAAPTDSLEAALAQLLAGQGMGKAPESAPEEPVKPEPPAVPEVKKPVVSSEAEEMLGNGLRDYAKGNFGSASQAFQKASNLDHPYAWFDLAVMYEQGRGVQRNLTTAFRWYLKAAEAGIPRAQYNAALMCFLGEGTDTDREKAFVLFVKAAEAGLAEAQAMAGAMCHGRKDAEGARMWLQKAADQGIAPAKDALEKL